MIDSTIVAHIKESADVLASLGLPESLKPLAFQELLRAYVPPTPQTVDTLGIIKLDSDLVSDDVALRVFMEQKAPRNAVETITCLVYWAVKKEGKPSVTADDLHELHLRAKIHPPKDIASFLRVLASKQYRRLDRVSDQPGHMTLSKLGETTVVFDVGQPA